MQIILDTNFLLVPAQFSVDVYEQLRSNGYTEFLTMSTCVDELKKLAKKYAKDVALAQQLMKKNNVMIIETSLGADAAIADYVSDEHNNKIAVATLDAELIKALKKNRVKVIRLRQKKYIIEA